jgi:hypothetical protein
VREWRDKGGRGMNMKEEIIVLCEQAIDGYEEGGERAEAKYLVDVFHEIRALLINEGESK